MELNSLSLSLLLVISGLTGVVLAMAYAYHRMVAQFQTMSKTLHTTQDKSLQEADRVLSAARQEALHTIEAANQKATQIITLGGKFAENQKNQLSTQMKSSTQEELSEYKDTLRHSQKELLISMGQVTDELQRAAENELTEFRKDLVKSTTETQSLFVKQLQTELSETETDIKQYKQELLKKANAQMFDVVQQVVQEVLHKSLTKSEHEALVIEALEEAKKHHVL